VIQVKAADLQQVNAILAQHELAEMSHWIGQPNTTDEIIIQAQGKTLLKGSRAHYQAWWSETSYRIQAMRDNAVCAEQEFDAICDSANTELVAKPSFDINDNIAAPYINSKV